MSGTLSSVPKTNILKSRIAFCDIILHCTFSCRSLLRATDTAVHGLIGGFSYWLACIICPDLVLNVFMLLPYLGFGCGSNKNESSKDSLPLNVFFSFSVAFMISSCIDLDHIIKSVIQIMNVSW